jgi:hypothetical protein
VKNPIRQGGFVAMEAAVWCLLCLPLGLLGVSMYALAHDENAVQMLPESLRDRGAVALQQTSFKLGDISAQACYWVYDVDAGTGAVVDAPVSSDCRSRGAIGATLSLETPRINRIRRGVGKPIVLGGEVVEFVPRVVLVGVAVGGRYQGLAEYLRDETVQHGAVWVPREDVVL